MTFVRRVYGVDEAAANARWILPGKLADVSTHPLSLYTQSVDAYFKICLIRRLR